MAAGQPMAPWDTLPYFDPVIETPFVSPSAGTQLVKANPNRVGLIFSVQATGGSFILVSTKKNATAGQGLVMNSTNTTIQLLGRNWGPLVTMDWYVGAGGAGTITVFELILAKWPEPGRRHARVRPANPS